jgi:E3 ubiquitin-protein ligase HUWE1
LEYRRCVRLALARAGQLLDAYFTRSFYKHMLRLPVTYEDLEAVDAEFFKSLV